MPILFVVSRANVHARYYKKLSRVLRNDPRVHVMGPPNLAVLRRLGQALDVDHEPAIGVLPRRKQGEVKSLSERLSLSR